MEQNVFRPSPYHARPLAARGVLPAPGGWRLKLYDIAYDSLPLDEARFAAGVEGALAGLPQPALTAQRPGVGALIRHAGRGMDYLVLVYWDNENECLVRVWVRDEGGWRAASAESFCVWDLQVIWHEREACVRHLLADAPDPDGYLADTL
ncbi:MAG: isochorismatase [Pseudogulbenkiania sp.]|nr:isochorismatase [Pseudogulbenkiania sp.]